MLFQLKKLPEIINLTRFLKSFWILYIDQIIVYNTTTQFEQSSNEIASFDELEGFYAHLAQALEVKMWLRCCLTKRYSVKADNSKNLLSLLNA
jgi:hypothetical protein